MRLFRISSHVISRQNVIRALGTKTTSDFHIGTEGSLVMRCRDTTGIVSQVTGCIVAHCSNLTSVDMHIEKQANPEDGSDVFLCRFGLQEAPHHQHAAFERDLAALVAQYDAASASLVARNGRRVDFRGRTRGAAEAASEGFAVGRSGAADAAAATWRVVRASGPPRVGVFVSKTEHCVLELLRRVRASELRVHVPFVLGNHPPSRHLAAALDESRIPFYHVPTEAAAGPVAAPNADDRGEAAPATTAGGEAASTSQWRPWEAAVCRVLEAPGHDTDCLVLARYMRVLSAPFLRWYEAGGGAGGGAGCGGFGGRPVVNIHHGLLPSFKGAAPYAQAHRAGVKLIGATAHFVTEQLDEGPIIEQQVRVVSHRDDYRALRLKSQTLEAAALADAVQYVATNRVARVGGRVVVFA
jgi:formyltetrahydrofolate deformylase